MEIGQAMHGIAARRDALRQAIAAALEVPIHQATLSRLLSDVAPPARDQLRAVRQQVAQLAHEVDRLTRTTAAIIQTQLALLDEVLACLTGSAASAPRYTAGGAMERPQGGSMFETRC
jgi:hypothetical protein